MDKRLFLRLFSGWLCLLLMLLPVCSLAADPGEEVENPADSVSCKAFAVISRETGQVLISENGSERLAPASTTKIMTMALALESGVSTESTYTTTRTSLEGIYADSTQLYTCEGEILTVEQLLYGAQVRSANDAANLLAEVTDGSIAAFVEHMNRKAEELGLENTAFVNAHGLSETGHYTSALDLAEITRWALTVPGFEEVFSAYTYTIPETNAATERPMTTTCEILRPESYGYYSDATGAKIGWTSEAKYTLSVAASRDGTDLICVLMGEADDTDLYRDAAYLLDYCFDNFHSVSVIPGLSDTEIPLFEGTRRKGTLYLSAPVCTVFLHNELSSRDIIWEEQVESSYDLSGEIAPAVTARLPEGNGYQSDLPVSFALKSSEDNLSGYKELPTGSLELAEEKPTLGETLKKLIWIVVPAGLAVLILLAALWNQLAKKRNIKVNIWKRYD